MVLDDPNRRIPKSDELSVGFEHQVGATISLSADYVHVFNREMFMTFDENKGTRATTASTAPIVRPDPTVQQVNTFFNAARPTTTRSCCR